MKSLLLRMVFVAVQICALKLNARGMEPGLGAEQFRPSPEQPIGWRGNSTGRYVDADGPTSWSRRLESSLDQVRCQTSRPDTHSGISGVPLLTVRTGQWAGHWQITRWLVLAPVKIPSGKDPIGEDILPHEGSWTPAAGEPLAGTQWKAVDGPLVDVGLVGKTVAEGNTAFLASYVYAPQETDAGIRARRMDDHFNFKVWINGKEASSWEYGRNHLKKGWNCLIFKIASARQWRSWNFWAGLYPFPESRRYRTENIRWTTRLPGWGFSIPISVGGKLFVTSEPNDLTCLDPQSGKIAWTRSQPVWLTLSEPERVAIPHRLDLESKFTRLSKLNAIDPAEWKAAEIEEHDHFATELSSAVQNALPKYKVGQGWGGGNSSPTPVSDGTHIYSWCGETGVLACYDLEGKRQYSHFIQPGTGEHGVNSSPVLVGKNLVLLAGHCVIGVDRDSGIETWRKHYRHPAYGSPVPAKIGKIDVVICPDGTILRSADGASGGGPVDRHDG